MDNIDPREVAQFEQLADAWWQPDGPFAPLHAINPLRTGWIAERTRLDGARVLDVGCGGGLLCEAISRHGAHVTGVDASAGAIAAAQAHAAENGLDIEYLDTDVARLADDRADQYDVVTCLELLEHTPEPDAMVAACQTLTRPGGDVFFSTINRNPKAWLFAVVGAEYLLDLVPRGTHEYARFIRPSELAGWARGNGLALRDSTGLHYNPLTRRFTLGANVDVNYLMHFRKSATDSVGS